MFLYKLYKYLINLCNEESKDYMKNNYSVFYNIQNSEINTKTIYISYNIANRDSNNLYPS